MVNYSKKQMQPLIEKYQINPETNKLFASLVEMFDGQPNYQIWAVKSVFSGAVSESDLKNIAQFADENQTSIKSLSKNNIVSYTTSRDFALLAREIIGIKRIKLIKSMIAMFNTVQRDMLTKLVFPKPVAPIDAYSSSSIKSYYELFTKVKNLPSARQKKLFSNASTVHTNANDIIVRINDTLKESYEWDKEDCISFITNNFPACKIVYENGPYMIAQISDYNASKTICGGSRTKWCITYQASQWENYVKPSSHTRRQYFYFDFSKNETDSLAHIGFTVEDGRGIIEAQTTDNSSLRGRGFAYGGGYVTIDKVLEKCGVKMSAFMNMSKRAKFGWTRAKFLEFIAANSAKYALAYDKDGMVIVSVLTNDGLSQLLEHTFINYRDVNMSTRSEDVHCPYVVLDFNLSENDEHSIMMLDYARDKYKDLTLVECYTAYGMRFDGIKYLNGHTISSADFLKRERIKPEVQLHKFIDEGDELGALKLLEDNPGLNVNFEFNENLPIFNALQHRMFKTFHAIYKNKNFDSKATNGIGGCILDTAMYVYISDGLGRKEKETLKGIIDSLLAEGNCDLNAKDLTDDSILSVACTHPSLLWVVEALASNPNVDVNSVNLLDMDAFSVAATSKNMEAMRIIGARPDLKKNELHAELANAFKFKLEDFIRPNAEIFERHESVRGTTSAQYAAKR